MKKLLTASMALMISIAPAIAQSEGTTPGKELAETVFSSIESNPNGMLDMGEFVNFGRSMFISMDSNDDANIEFEEFTSFDFGFDSIAEDSDKKRAYETAQKILFAFWDRDGNKKISNREYHTSMISDFRRADINNDAFLSKEEFLRGYVVNIAYRAALTGR